MFHQTDQLRDESLEAIAFISQVLGSLLSCDPKRDREVIRLYQLLSEADPQDLLEGWPYIETEEQDRAHQAFTGLCSAELDDELICEYRRLFVGPGHLALAPFGSVYTDHERVTYGATTLDFRDFLRKAGMSIQLADPVPEDHIGYQLLLLSELCKHKPCYVRECLENHILPWALYYFSMLEKVTLHRFFQALASLAYINLHSIQQRESLSVKHVRLFPPLI